MSKTADENPKVEWENLDWRKAEFWIFKLQKRIYRASQEGEIKLLHQLQRTLTNSWYAKLVAVRRVTQENKGKKTAGIDGIKSLTPQQRLKLAQKLKINGTARPTKRVWIPKPGNKENRPLGIPTIEDRAKQTLLKMAIEPEWEAKFEKNSYGFRPGRSCHDAIQAIRTCITKSPKYVLDADIAKCFDSINHNKLLKKLNTFPKYNKQIKAWLQAGVIDFSEWAERKGYNETNKGTPQGGAISPLLANIALHGMENAIEAQFPSDKTGRIRLSKQKYGKIIRKPTLIRYADDFVILCEDLKIVEECRETIEKWLADIGLELKPNKTRLAHSLNEHQKEHPGFDFLGCTIRQFQVGKHHSGKDSKNNLLGYCTIVKPSKKSVQAHYKTLSMWIEKFKGDSQIPLIKKLNSIIRGWCNYFAPYNSSQTFQKLSYLVWNRLWRWAKRRHPNKGKKWVKRRYWRTIQNDNWVFASNREGKNPFQLLKHTELPSGVKYAKVKGALSPYDGDELYWTNRLGDKYKTVDPQKARLLKKQKGKCQNCGTTFKPKDQLEKHHIKHKSKGGNNTDYNLALVHLHCHDKLHAKETKEKATQETNKLMGTHWRWEEDMLIIPVEKTRKERIQFSA
ncbi:MAG: group II intron reverse transcriptase/maturase [Xenococcaceae cyanobacterium MO_207.B15]|nr:group II intron reverse transcriptase/maturase [Xenococcaceae cyanobacterium MO_207.B15]